MHDFRRLQQVQMCVNIKAKAVCGCCEIVLVLFKTTSSHR